MWQHRCSHVWVHGLQTTNVNEEIFPRDSEANASESLENLEECHEEKSVMSPVSKGLIVVLYYIYGNIRWRHIKLFVGNRSYCILHFPPYKRLFTYQKVPRSQLKKFTININIDVKKNVLIPYMEIYKKLASLYYCKYYTTIKNTQ